MDSLKDKLPIVGVGLAALAVAGYLVYSTAAPSKSKKVEESIDQDEHKTEAPKIVPKLDLKSFWIAASTDPESREAQVLAWVTEQIEALLGAQLGGKLRAPGMELGQTNFFALVQMIRERYEAQNFTQKSARAAARQDFIESEHYMSLVIADCNLLLEAFVDDATYVLE